LASTAAGASSAAVAVTIRRTSSLRGICGGQVLHSSQLRGLTARCPPGRRQRGSRPAGSRSGGCCSASYREADRNEQGPLAGSTSPPARGIRALAQTPCEGPCPFSCASRSHALPALACQDPPRSYNTTPEPLVRRR
jgi:hypothetical protein